MTSFGEKPTPPRESIRSGLGIPQDAKVVFVFYESQCEQAWRRYGREICLRYDFVLLYPNSLRALKHFGATYPDRDANLRLVDDFTVSKACDEFLAFRFIEDPMRDAGIPIRIVDPANRWMSAELSQ